METHDYPDREHYTPPEEEHQVLADELRYEVDNDNEHFPQTLEALMRQYGDTGFGQGLHSYSALAAQSQPDFVRSASSNSHPVDINFFAGGILAIHSTLKTQKLRYVRSRLWQINLLDRSHLRTQQQRDHHVNQLNRAESDIAGARERCHDLVSDLPDEVQLYLGRIATKMYPDQPAGRDEFLTGYVHTRRTILELSSAVQGRA